MGSTRLALPLLLCLLLGVCEATAQGSGNIVWVPTASTFDGTAFTQVADGVGVTSFGLPGPTNPAGAGFSQDGFYAFGFATAIPGDDGPMLSQMELSQSPLKAGTQLVLAFDKGAEDHISFVALLADASEPGNIGVKVISSTRFEIRATIADPAPSETNNPDEVSAAFGLIVQTTNAPEESFNFRGTTFVTDMLWVDLEPMALAELPQFGEAPDISGFVVGLAAQGVSLSEANPVTFTAYIPERLFEAGRAHGVEVDGANCLGYRTYVELTGSEDGFFKLNSPDDQPAIDAMFDTDGDGSGDALWAFRIRNSQWSRQSLMFGRVEEDEIVPTATPESTWGTVKRAAH